MSTPEVSGANIWMHLPTVSCARGRRERRLAADDATAGPPTPDRKDER